MSEGTRLLTEEDCAKGLEKATSDLKIYIQEDAPLEKRYRAEAEIAIWTRLLEHLHVGELVTINNKNEIHWLPEATRNY